MNTAQFQAAMYPVRVRQYARTLTPQQLTRLFRNIAERAHFSAYGDYATFARCEPSAYATLNALNTVFLEKGRG